MDIFWSLLLLIYQVHVIQENKDILGDGYEGDVLGESTPDVIVSEFVCFFFSNFQVNAYSVFSTNSLLVMHFDSPCILHVIPNRY